MILDQVEYFKYLRTSAEHFRQPNITVSKYQLMNVSGTEGYVSPDGHLDASL
jgi:hypothetical protein